MVVYNFQELWPHFRNLKIREAATEVNSADQIKLSSQIFE